MPTFQEDSTAINLGGNEIVRITGNPSGVTIVTITNVPTSGKLYFADTSGVQQITTGSPLSFTIPPFTDAAFTFEPDPNFAGGAGLFSATLFESIKIPSTSQINQSVFIAGSLDDAPTSISATPIDAGFPEDSPGGYYFDASETGNPLDGSTPPARFGVFLTGEDTDIQYPGGFLPLDKLTFSIVSASAPLEIIEFTDGSGTIFPYLFLQEDAEVDFEQTPTISVTIRATDLGNRFIDQSFTFDVSDYPEQIVVGATTSNVFGYDETNTGADLVIGTTADNFVDGGSGSDTIFGLDGADTLLGGAGPDVLSGGNGDDSLLGGSSGDQMLGLAGDDRMFGQIGQDTMSGNDGNDYLAGANANDVLFGDAGQDTLLGQGGSDFLDGGDGNDSLSGGASADLLLGGAGSDTLDGGAFNDQLSGGLDADTLLGGSGLDTLFGDEGDDVLNGGSGADFLEGGDGADELIGGVGIDDLRGGAGADTLSGGSANDRLTGGAGADLVDGGSGSDVLLVLAGEGGDTLTGGAGADTFEFHSGFGTATVSDFSAQDTLDLSNVTAVTSFADLDISYGADITIDWGTGDSLTLTGASLVLGSSDFIFI